MPRQHETSLTDLPPVPYPRPVPDVNIMCGSIKGNATQEGRRAAYKSNGEPSETPPPYKEPDYETCITFSGSNNI